MILDTLYCAEDPRGVVLAVGASEKAARKNAPAAIRVVKIVLSPGQLAMVKDGMPAELFRSSEQRAAWWRANPPKAMPIFGEPKKDRDEATLKLIAELEQQKTLKTKARINRLLASKKKVDTTGLIWNSQTAKWEKDPDMAKIKIQAFDKDGALVARASSSIQEDATDEQMAEKVAACFKRGGQAVNAISVTGIGGQRLSAWVMKEGSVTRDDDAYQSAPVSSDPAEATPDMSEPGTEQPNDEETDVAKKVKAKSKSKSKSKNGNGNGKPKGPGVIDTIKETISRTYGATIDEIVAVLVKKFPDRKAKSMTSTAKIQANKNAKRKDKDEKRGLVYYGKGR